MIFDSIFRSDPLENPSTPITSESFDDFIAGGFSHVSPETAMNLAAVYSCIYVLSSSLAQLPLHVLRKKGKIIESGNDHPAYYLLHDEPNRMQSSFKWRETEQARILGFGNSYTRIIRNNRGQVTGLESTHPNSSDLLKRDGRYIYSALIDDRPTAIHPDDIIHVKALGFDGLKGKSPIRQHAETIGLGLESQRYGKSFFGSNGRPTGIVSVKGDLNDGSWSRLKAVWKKSVSGLVSGTNRTILLPSELNYQAMTISPEDMQFLDTRKFNRSEIAGIFNVPAHMINDLERATFSNISELSVEFVKFTMMPWVVNWEQEINRKLFSSAERKAGYYVKFNLAGLLRGTPKERADFYHFAINDGWMSRNEARVLEDMNPIDGLDEMLVSVNQSKLPAKGNEGVTK